MFAKGDDKKQVTYYMPVPDALPLADAPDKQVRPLGVPALFPSLPKYYASTRYGIDVSRYQGNINWQEVSKDSRVSFVYLKATESTGLVDKTYRCNLREARRVGLPVGVYHFFSAKTPAHQQLANFMSAVDPMTQDLIPIVDVEVAPRRKSQVVPFLKRLRAFVDGVEKYFGCKPMIYTSQNFYKEFLAGKFLDCPIMLAKYSEGVPEVGEDIRFLVWQFTASGSIRGITGNVDRSCLMNHYTVDDIRYHGGKKK
ncbi:MAG: GH25 family lysozyme [Bacteroidaceae bacterium]|nr:GH25 family lysozyme [Bacteroidaceae bacterium]